MIMNNNNYEISNKIENVRLNSFKSVYSESLLNSGDDIVKRQKRAENLLNYLCNKFKIADVLLCVTNKPRPRKGNTMQINGCYVVGRDFIIIYNTTAKTNKTVSIKSFYDTLLHEFMHHYDYKVLGLTDSLHTKGFYKRITDLKNKLA